MTNEELIARAYEGVDAGRYDDVVLTLASALETGDLRFDGLSDEMNDAWETDSAAFGLDADEDDMTDEQRELAGRKAVDAVMDEWESNYIAAGTSEGAFTQTVRELTVAALRKRMDWMDTL